uniref:Discs, large homolog 5b (Drosophila), tandem duplicate 1 n=1 Tax=Pygocentrus nattereri TaxID=42514 RepID=A0AAR2LFY8_PYGNA
MVVFGWEWLGNGASSPPPAHVEKRAVSEKLDSVVLQLRQVTRERDELRKRLALSSPGTTFDDCRPSVKSAHDYERLKLQCMKAMADLQSLQNQHTQTLKKCEEAMKEADFYHTLHGRVLDEQAGLRAELDAVRQEYTQLLHTCDHLRRIHDDDQREVADMRLQQQVKLKESSSSDVVNKLYDAAMEKLEALRKEYDALQKRYSEKTACQGADAGRLEQLEAENRRLQKQLDALLKQREIHPGLLIQHQCLTSQMLETVQQDFSKLSVENSDLQREVERLQAEVTRYKSVQLRAVQDADRLREERDSVLNEYRLIMSERDQVIKEVERLQTGLEAAEAKLKNTSSERRVATEELEALRQKQDSATVDMERVSKEIEVLRKQCEAVSQELKEAVQEAEVAKCRRDWAFKERDKIVAERESIRTLCDNLRRERDRAVSDLADALRNLDDMRKRKNELSRELKELKERLEEEQDKEARYQQLMAHNSHDSAIDTDSLEWETEVVEFERESEDMDLKALGFDVAEGVNDPYLPGDCGIFVTKVDKGSVADGRLRVNDWLLKINDVDLANKDKKQVLKAVLNGGGVINMVVRRRRSLGGRIITPVHLNLTGNKDSGVVLESGMYVASITPGSPAARDASLCPGDRLLAINGIAVDNKSLSECEALLRDCRESLSLSIMKVSTFLLLQYGTVCEHGSNGKVPPLEVHTRNCRSQPLNSSSSSTTHSDIYCGQRGAPCPTEAYHELCYQRPDPSKRPLTFHPIASGDGITVETVLEKGIASQKNSGGTWPKVMASAVATPEIAPPLSIFKTPKKRKTIFDVDIFKRPETPSKLGEYITLAHAGSRPQGVLQSPPEPPKRSDSIKFKHKQQGSSASDSTITTGTPPATPGGRSDLGVEGLDRNGNLLQRQNSGDAGTPTPRRACDEDVVRHAVDELEIRKAKSSSASTQRRALTPLQIPIPLQVPHYIPYTDPSTLNTAGLSAAKQTSTQPPHHQGRQRSADLSDQSSRSRIHHNTHSLPSSARQGLSQYRTERIKIPSTPRYTRSTQGSDRGTNLGSSPSLVTPPLSPLSSDAASFTSSQSHGSLSTQPRLSVSPAPIGDRRKDRPYTEEPRSVTIPKGAEPLGISIVGGENGGIFVSKVTGGSIAQRHNLEFGDQLLEVNGINLRNATEQQARLIIGQQCDTITILAQYNPHMYQPGNHSRSSSRMESVSACSTPVSNGAGTPDACSTIDTLSEQDEGTMTPPSKNTTPGGRLVEPRQVTVRKGHVELGVKICGGNLTGIYVESLEEKSPAGGTDGLQPGDFILEVLGLSLRNKTTEEAYMEMLKPAETVTLRVQNRPEDWRRIRNTPGDGFYVRALYDRVGESEQELSFKKDDILYVDDTLPGGNFGYWLAWQLDESAQKLARGQIPSKYMMDQEFPRRCSITEGKDEGKTVSAAARRSFFRRKLKHKRSGSRDGKDAPAPDSISTDSITFAEDCISLAYQRVLKLESTNRRPVLVLGPLVEPIKDMLVREAPGKYCRCLLEVMKASQQAIERGVKDCLFIDYKRRSGHFDVTTVASIKEIIEKDCHCLIDIAPHAIERLHSVNIYPIVIFIRYKNAKQIKEQKDPVYLRDKVSQKHSKEQFEAAQKMEQEYSKYFTGVVQGGPLSSICTQVMAIVEQEQNKPLWLPDASA